MLEGVGLTRPQESVYFDLLAHTGQTLEEIATRHRELGPQVAAITTELAELGLVTRLAGQPQRLTAIAPDVALEALANTRIEGARRVATVIPELMERFWASADTDQAVDFIEILTSENGLLERWRQIAAMATKEIRAFERPPSVTNPLVTNVVELDRLANDVAVRVIYTQSVIDTPGRWADIESGIAAGEQARVAPSLPAKLILFDDVAATITVQSGPAGAISVIVVHRSPLLDALSTLFEASWSQAIPLSVSATTPTAARRDDSDLIRLLAAGLGDDAIHRALGVSPTTVNRRVRALISSVGARTRFQAGFQLGRMHATKTLQRQADKRPLL